MTNVQKLQDAFRQGLALPATFDVTHAESASVRQWDSVAHLQLVVAIEDAFRIRLSPAELSRPPRRAGSGRTR